MLLLSLLVAPALFRLSAAQVPAAPFQCPINDVMLTQCRGEKDCLYPNPGSCNSYIQCSMGSTFLSATPTIKRCAPDHEWNDKEKKCDVPGKSTCPVSANVKATGMKIREAQSKDKLSALDGVANGIEDVLRQGAIKGHGARRRAREAQSKDKFSCTGPACPGTVVGGVTDGVENVLRQGAHKGSGKKNTRGDGKGAPGRCTGPQCPTNVTQDLAHKIEDLLKQGVPKDSGKKNTRGDVKGAPGGCTGPECPTNVTQDLVHKIEDVLNQGVPKSSGKKDIREDH